MESPISLIVGLGNPGPEYEKTRHNAGAWYVEALARQYNQPLRPDSKYHGRHARLLIEGKPVFLLIPDTFMNLSGKAISALANFYRIPVTEILVAHDELDLLPGFAKLKRGGGHGGHNGLRDTITKMGNSKEFLRLRIGIGHPGSKERVTGHVLGKAPSSEQQLIDAAIDEALRCTPILIGKGLHPAMNRLNSFNANS